MNSVNFEGPSLSIIVPVYNAETTLDRCLSFLLNQSYKNFEVICVDDCSVDSSSEILFKYQARYPSKILYVKTKERLGPGGARNCGISSSHGEYIGFVDSDDWPDSSLFNVVMQNILKTKADIAVFGVKDEFESPANSRIRYKYYDLNIIEHDFALRLLSQINNNNSFISPMVCQKIYKRSFLDLYNITFHTSSYFEDDLFTFQCFLHKSKIILVPGVYYHYYQRPDSITHSFSKKHIDDLSILISDLRSYLMDLELWENCKQIYYSFCNKCIRSTVNMLFTAEPKISIQKQYLSYLFKRLQSVYPATDLIDYVDIGTIKRIFIRPD